MSSGIFQSFIRKWVANGLEWEDLRLKRSDIGFMVECDKKPVAHRWVFLRKNCALWLADWKEPVEEFARSMLDLAVLGQ